MPNNLFQGLHPGPQLSGQVAGGGGQRAEDGKWRLLEQGPQRGDSGQGMSRDIRGETTGRRAMVAAATVACAERDAQKLRVAVGMLAIRMREGGKSTQVACVGGDPMMR